MARLNPHISLIIMLLFAFPAHGRNIAACSGAITDCVLEELSFAIDNIDDKKWQDIALRELAKSMTLNNDADNAIKLLNQIEHPDTKALTIRGIGMNAAKLKQSETYYKDLFKRLLVEADRIEHKPSHAIAITYISMAQSYAQLDDDAIKTAFTMENKSLKHKALGEIAEIQAEDNKNDLALKTILLIDSEAYRNKSYRIISKIMANKGNIDYAFTSAKLITNNTAKAKSLQSLVNKLEALNKND